MIRQKKLEKAMDEEGLPDEEVRSAFSSVSLLLSVISLTRCLFLQKVMRRSQHARKETEFLRLKRTRLGLDDFESLKVIGRGAFGEVGVSSSQQSSVLTAAKLWIRAESSQFRNASVKFQYFVILDVGVKI